MPRMVAAAECGPRPALILPSLSCMTSAGLTPGLCKTGGQPGGLPCRVSTGRAQTSNTTRAPSKWLRTSLCCEDAGVQTESTRIWKQPFTYPCSRRSPLFLGWSPLPGSPWLNPGLRSGCALCVFKHITNHRRHADIFMTINSGEKNLKLHLTSPHLVKYYAEHLVPLTQQEIGVIASY